MKTQKEISTYRKGMNDELTNILLDGISQYTEQELKDAYKRYTNMSIYNNKLYLISFKNNKFIVLKKNEFEKLKDILRWIIN